MSDPPFALVATKRLLVGLLSFLGGQLVNILVFLVDLVLFIVNLAIPDRRIGHVVPHGHPGAGGKWPAFVPPKQGDSRCSCPALNAMANHGILPHSGRNIKFKELSAVVRQTYNFAPTFCFFVPNYAANMLNRSYWTDSFDLADIDAHNCIEHDGSLVRVDAIEDPDQSKIAIPLVERVLRAGSGPNGDLTPADLSRLLGQRRVEAKKANGTFSLAFIHRFFGSSNASTLLTIFGGRLQDLRTFLTEERFPETWEPRIRHQMGLTMMEFNNTVLKVELGIREEVDGTLQAAGQERYGLGSKKAD
ncbi:chloroperoxidase-like protein [Lentinus tigrinus ALCF2SS1-7]|uniref:Chloroperoxidase-like protein n=1 Tax=Lentinus tigrinus ALCF2SS1-6 TaxID=1328759 RepID=A0A5C2SEP2_9APHY|nr:chloroperoxidase-like protein [Lentinus tigrinus ALCF2SS1-6]RPD76031.1 chloroperoxidase-like protein [Lentinus tigrinus ALCF2SS1-7]